MKTTIITGADAALFDLLLGLIRSIRACAESREVDLCILDVGLTEEQVSQLTPLVTRIVPAEWDFDFPGRETCPSWAKAMFCRPYFPRYFPDYELLIWIDADAWLCNWQAIRLLIGAGQAHGLAIVPEIDRCYSHCYHLRPGVLNNVRQTYLQGFGAEAAERYTFMPIVNCGVFAMRRDVPHWRIWAELLVQATQRCIRPLVEQCALNIAIYTGQIPAYFLPSWCNWNCAHSVPFLEIGTRTLHTPLAPRDEISICHLTDLKRQPVRMACSDEVFRVMPLTFDAVRKEQLPAPA